MAEAAGSLSYVAEIGDNFVGGGSQQTGVALIPNVAVGSATASNATIVYGVAGSTFGIDARLIPGAAAANSAAFFLNILPLSSIGPVFDHLAEPIPSFGSGSTCDHIVEVDTGAASGPIDDSIIGNSDPTASGALLDWTVVVIPAAFNPNDPSRLAVPESKIPPPRNVQCTGSGGDSSPGVCGRGD